jgi:hypothetical protein
MKNGTLRVFDYCIYLMRGDGVRRFGAVKSVVATCFVI